MATIFERIGGNAAVDAAVERFYQIVLADERIKHFFAGVDMNRQATHQKLFFKYAYGGLPNFPGRAMKAAHERLVTEMGLNDSHFDAVLDDLGRALSDLNVPSDLIAEAAAVAETTREAVLGRK
jgi:hemoglobin